MEANSIFATSDLAIGTVEPINLNQMFTFRKEKDHTGKFVIAFYKADPYLDHQTILWKYSSENHRDCDYETLINNFSYKLS